jgi:hypothetical protein
MMRSLEERGYSLRGLLAFPDIASQTQRYLELGYSHASVWDMNDVYYRLLPQNEVARIERLELFDEVEEWHLMSAHYCIAIAVNDPEETSPGAAQPKDSAPSSGLCLGAPSPPPRAGAADGPRDAHSAAAEDGMPAPAPKISRPLSCARTWTRRTVGGVAAPRAPTRSRTRWAARTRGTTVRGTHPPREIGVTQCLSAVSLSSPPQAPKRHRSIHPARALRAPSPCYAARR